MAFFKKLFLYHNLGIWTGERKAFLFETPFPEIVFYICKI